MKKALSLISILLLSISLFSCSSRKIKSDLTPEIVAKAYESTSYSTWCHNISEDDSDAYEYESELKVSNPEETEDYIFVYFFIDNDSAKAYETENSSKTGFLWFLSLLFGGSTKVNYDRYDYMVVESYKSDSTKSRKDMIRIFENAIYE